MQIHDQFESIDAARQAIQAFILDNGESFKVVASNKKQYIIRCKDYAYSFRIWANRSKSQIVLITKIFPHSYSPTTHYKSKQSQLVDYLMPYHHTTIIDNHNITIA
jgi:hypothetical protein